jgi:hypothetical protein
MRRYLLYANILIELLLSFHLFEFDSVNNLKLQN